MERKNKILLIVLLAALLFINLIAIILIFKPSSSGMSGFSVLNDKSEDINQEENNPTTTPTIEITPTITSRSSGGSRSGGGSSGGGSGGCTDSCQNLGYECGTWTICGQGKNCGSCGKGQTCVDGKCKIEIVSNASIFINPAENNKAKNEEFNVYVKIDTENEIYAVQFNLVFDKNIVEVLNVSEESFLKKDGASTFPIIKINNTLGKIEFASTRFGTQAGVTGQGSLAIIKFKAKSSGSTILNLENVKIVNPDLQEINVSLTNSKVVVS